MLWESKCRNMQAALQKNVTGNTGWTFGRSTGSSWWKWVSLFLTFQPPASVPIITLNCSAPIVMRMGKRDVWASVCAGKSETQGCISSPVRFGFRAWYSSFLLAENLLFCYALLWYNFYYLCKLIFDTFLYIKFENRKSEILIYKEGLFYVGR